MERVGNFSIDSLSLVFLKFEATWPFQSTIGPRRREDIKAREDELSRPQ